MLDLSLHRRKRQRPLWHSSRIFSWLGNPFISKLRHSLYKVHHLPLSICLLSIHRTLEPPNYQYRILSRRRSFRSSHLSLSLSSVVCRPLVIAAIDCPLDRLLDALGSRPSTIDCMPCLNRSFGCSERGQTAAISRSSRRHCPSTNVLVR